MADADQTLAAWRAGIRAGWGNGAHDATLDRIAGVAAAVQQLHTGLGEVPGLANAVVRAWIEPLAPDPSHLGGHLAGLAS